MLANEPVAGRDNGLVHRVRSEIEIARPRHRSFDDANLGEGIVVTETREDPGIVRENEFGYVDFAASLKSKPRS